MKNLMKNPISQRTVLVLLMTLFMAFCAVPVLAMPKNTPDPAVNSQTTDKAKEKVLMSRLYEIRKKTQAPMNYAEKQRLRNEVSAIKKDLKQLHGGVYISCGALILILLLFIILT